MHFSENFIFFTLTQLLKDEFSLKFLTQYCNFIFYV